MRIMKAKNNGQVKDGNSKFVSPFTSVNCTSKCVYKRNSNQSKRVTVGATSSRE